MRVAPALLAVFAMLGGATAGGRPALAQPQRGDKAAAKMFEQGRALIKAGKIDDACPLFARSYELERAVGTELNLADCHERLGHLADAWRLFDDAASQSEREGNSARQGVARERANALLPKLGTLVVEIAEPGVPELELEVAGQRVTPAAQVERKVDPGRVTVTARVPDRPAFEITTPVDAGKTVVAKVPAFRAVGGDGPVSAAPAIAPETRRARSRVLLAAVAGGVGIGALVTTAALGLSARSLNREPFSDHDCTNVGGSPVCNANGAAEVNRAARDANIATGFGIAGLVLVAGGAILYFTAPHELVIAPTATTTSAGLALSGAF